MRDGSTHSAMIEQLASGAVSAEQAAKLFLERIDRLDGGIASFVSVNHEHALAEARALDRYFSQHGRPVGPLHGVPFAVKDIFLTEALPTQYNALAYAGHHPKVDAAVVRALRAAGAVLLGKVTTVEFAGMGREPTTVHPKNPARSPGGSSTGSAAAVAAGLVPLTVGSQTGGSTLRPAAYCGIYGYKPTWGVISTEGMKPFAPSLDTVGLMADSAALLRQAAVACGAATTNPISTGQPLRMGIYPTRYWSDAAPLIHRVFNDTAALLQKAGHQISEVQDPFTDLDLNALQDVVMWGEGGVSVYPDSVSADGTPDEGVATGLARSAHLSVREICRARDRLAAARVVFDTTAADYDVLLCPAVPDVAPIRGEGNGLAVFNRLFTALHVPCATWPAAVDKTSGMPVGLQLVAARGEDDAVLRACAVMPTLNSASESPS